MIFIVAMNTMGYSAKITSLETCTEMRTHRLHTGKEAVHRTIAKKAKIWNFLDKDFFKNEICLFI